ncbi:hypothetical protein F7734_00745 [Scytonema sp. UIC 10036]|nr:hypothetical protein [Scytonema sp. UIC 10036]MUG91105.1 hypothetical protein [Scytonema sp. UIC 10036]
MYERTSVERENSSSHLPVANPIVGAQCLAPLPTYLTDLGTGKVTLRTI